MPDPRDDADRTLEGPPASSGDRPQATARPLPIGVLDSLVSRSVQGLLPTRLVQVEVAVAVRDEAMARHALASSRWTVVRHVDRGDRRILVLVARQPQGMPHRRADQVAVEIRAILNSHRVECDYLTVDDRVPEQQPLFRWALDRGSSDPTRPEAGPTAIYTPESSADAGAILSDPAVTRRWERVRIGDPDEPPRTPAKWRRWLVGALLAMVLVGGALGFVLGRHRHSPPIGLDGLDPEAKAVLVVLAALTLAALLAHLAARTAYVLTSDGWAHRHPRTTPMDRL